MAVTSEVKEQQTEERRSYVVGHRQTGSFPTHCNFLFTSLVLIITLLSCSRLCQGNYYYIIILLLGRVALRAQRPIVVKLSRERSVGRSVGLSSALWKSGGSDPDAVWHHRSDGSRDEAGGGVLAIGPREGILLGANLGRAIVTNGDFMGYVSDSAATRPSSQITLGRLVLNTLGSKDPDG